MSDLCAAHRPYLAALADGELDLVPESTREHAGTCERCAAEVADHGLLGEKLRAALLPRPAGSREGERRSRSRARMYTPLAAAASLVVAAVGATVGWRATHGGVDTVQAAVDAAARPPLVQSADPAAIAEWCARSSDRHAPPIAIPALSAVGARMDSVGGATVVTIFYRDAAADTVAVGWLDAQGAPLSGSSVEARSVGAQTVLLVRTPAGTAVLSGAPPDELWRSGAALEALTG